MALVIVRPDKFAKLPKDFQEAVSKLDSVHLLQLQAALSVHEHFDLLGLPIEIRYEIYGYLLSSSTSSRGIKLAPLPSKRANTTLLPGLALLTVSKQVSAEAFTIMRERNRLILHCNLGITADIAKSKSAIRLGGDIELTIQLHSLNLVWLSKNPRALGICLRTVAKEMIDAHAGSCRVHPVKISIRFMLPKNLELSIKKHKLDFFDPSQTFKTGRGSGDCPLEAKFKVLFIKAQLMEMMKYFRELTTASLPQVEVLSNVDRTRPGTKLSRRSATEVRVSETLDGFSNRGCVRLRGNEVRASNLNVIFRSAAWDKGICSD